jgi:glucuronate isomerase
MATSAFLHDDVLLSNEVAIALFHGVAQACPIVDVHSHLSTRDIATNRVWPDLTELWLADDHYKWRAMRAAGVAEALITGDADPWDRFLAWARTVPRLVRNPLYLWTHLELRRVFGIDLPLSESTAREIWDEANAQLPRWPAQALLAHFNVRAVATTNGPGDALPWHDALRSAPTSPPFAMVPTLRPDDAHRLLHDPMRWNAWADDVGATTGTTVSDLDSLLAALAYAWRRFVALGCRASDHGLTRLPDRPRDAAAADSAVRAARAGAAADAKGADAVLLEVVTLAAQLANDDDAVLQLHLGPRRDVSPRLFQQVGHDAGADVADDERQAPGLARFLHDLEAAGSLPRTILYNLNPADNALLVAMAGAFGRDGVPGVVQWGPPWWFNDSEPGMRRALDDLASIGQVGSFVGMLTDSRSILSMTRHELFRRIVCDVIGADVVTGRIPDDRDHLDGLVRDISVGNAVRFFGFPAAWAGPSR